MTSITHPNSTELKGLSSPSKKNFVLPTIGGIADTAIN
jgi:hypothetical protein